MLDYSQMSVSTSSFVKFTSKKIKYNVWHGFTNQIYRNMYVVLVGWAVCVCLQSFSYMCIAEISYCVGNRNARWKLLTSRKRLLKITDQSQATVENYWPVASLMKITDQSQIKSLSNFSTNIEYISPQRSGIAVTIL